MDNQHVQIAFSGNADEVASAVSTLFGRQSGLAAAPATVQNGATIQCGTIRETIQVEEGDTVSRLFAKGAARLGLDLSKSLTFQDGGSVIPGDTLAESGAEYVAVPNHDQKG